MIGGGGGEAVQSFLVDGGTGRNAAQHRGHVRHLVGRVGPPGNQQVVDGPDQLLRRRVVLRVLIGDEAPPLVLAHPQIRCQVDADRGARPWFPEELDDRSVVVEVGAPGKNLAGADRPPVEVELDVPRAVGRGKVMPEPVGEVARTRLNPLTGGDQAQHAAGRVTVEDELARGRIPHAAVAAEEAHDAPQRGPGTQREREVGPQMRGIGEVERGAGRLEQRNGRAALRVGGDPRAAAQRRAARWSLPLEVDGERAHRRRIRGELRPGVEGVERRAAQKEAQPDRGRARWKLPPVAPGDRLFDAAAAQRIAVVAPVAGHDASRGIEHLDPQGAARADVGVDREGAAGVAQRARQDRCFLAPRVERGEAVFAQRREADRRLASLDRMGHVESLALPQNRT